MKTSQAVRGTPRKNVSPFEKTFVTQEDSEVKMLAPYLMCQPDVN